MQIVDGKELKRRRETLAMIQEQLASVLDVDRMTVSSGRGQDDRFPLGAWSAINPATHLGP